MSFQHLKFRKIISASKIIRVFINNSTSYKTFRCVILSLNSESSDAIYDDVNTSFNTITLYVYNANVGT